jgi:hypothetical protein
MNGTDAREQPETHRAWTETDVCAFVDCTRGAIHAALLCDHHWLCLPDRLKRGLARAHALRQLGDPSWQRKLREAQTDALNYILWLRGDR